MRKMLAILLSLILLAAVPAQASEAIGQTLLVDDAQTYNALLAAKAIHKTILAPGESFSFNETVGPRTSDAGYVPALGGSGVESVGGGCAQAASALYLALGRLSPGAVSFEGLSLYGDRFTGGYVNDGSHAVLVDYDAGRDFRFVNLSGGQLGILFAYDETHLKCKVVLDAAATPAPDYDTASTADRAIVTLNCAENPDSLANLTLAAGSVYDVCLASGDIFSFNDAVGPRNPDYGYVPAPDASGETVIGGGCEQLASALWLLIQDRPDFAVVEKSTYGSSYAQDYVASSADAILVDGYADFAFRYTGPGAITLYAKVEGNTLACALSESN